MSLLLLRLQLYALVTFAHRAALCSNSTLWFKRAAIPHAAIRKTSSFFGFEPGASPSALAEAMSRSLLLPDNTITGMLRVFGAPRSSRGNIIPSSFWHWHIEQNDRPPFGFCDFNASRQFWQRAA
jgi:hypothetical protein